MGLAYLALAWLVGVVVAAFADGATWAIVAASVEFGVVSVVWIVRWQGRDQDRGPDPQKNGQGWGPSPRSVVFVAFGVSLVLVGGWRYGSADGPDVSLGRLNGETVQMRAVVSEEPDEGDTTISYRLEVREVLEDGVWRAESGKVLAQAPVEPRYEYGDLLEVEGKLEEPPVFEDFNYRDYLLGKGVVSLMNRPRVLSVIGGQGDWWTSAAISVRQGLDGALRDVLPEPHAGLAQGVLFGAKSRIPDELTADMRTTGTSHMVAVSGQNVTIVAAFVIAALAWVIGRRRAAWVSGFAIIAYVVLVGAQASVVRAAAMGLVYVLSIMLGRQNNAVFALGIAAAGMTAVNPQVVDDIGFQLSFAATVGLTTLAGPLRNWIEAGVARWPAAVGFPPVRAMTEGSAVTMAAILFTLPVTAVHFGEISLVAPVANLFVVPAFLAVAATSGIAALLDLVVPGSSGVGAWIAWPATEYMVQAVRLFASLPFASVTIGGVTVWMAATWYGVLLSGTWWLAKRPMIPIELPRMPVVSRRRGLIPAGGLVLLIVLVGFAGWLWLNEPERGRLTVTVMDVGQGDAILIEGPRGQRVLVDGGPGSQPVDEALGRNLPFDDRRIDLVALTHADSDHLSGLLDVVRNYDVREVLDNPNEGESALYDAWEVTLDETGVPVTTAQRGQTIDLGDGARIEVLAPDSGDPLFPIYSTNRASTVLRVSMGDVTFLLTGDLDWDGEADLAREGTDVRATVLKVGHHGSKTSTSPAFLARVDPVVDVISVGVSNGFGHPTQEVLDRLAGDVVLRTDQDGDVRMETDGTRVWVEPGR